MLKYTKVSSVTVTKSADFDETADLVTFTEDILNGKHHFLCSLCFSDVDIESGQWDEIG